MFERTSLSLFALAAACAAPRTPTVAPPPAPALMPAPNPSPAPVTSAPVEQAEDPSVATNLRAMIALGVALADHVGPDVARAMYDDLDRRPGGYFSALEQHLQALVAGRAAPTLFYAVPLWRLRRHDEDRARHLAGRFVIHLQGLVQTSESPEQASALRERLRLLSVIRGGVDVTPGPRWRRADASSLSACVTSTPDQTTVVVVARGCTCGEPLACRASVRGGALQIELSVNPEAPGVCTDCYPTSTACTLPTLPPSSALRVEVNGTGLTTWRTDASARFEAAFCGAE